MCPEADEVTLSQGLPWIPQTSIQVMLTDPRDGPLLPWQDRDDSVTWSNKGTSQFDKCLKECCSPKECWQKVWLPRYGAGGVHMLKVPYEHMTNKPELSRHELLAHTTVTSATGCVKVAWMFTAETERKVSWVLVLDS